jgi:hypothetical protein
MHKKYISNQAFRHLVMPMMVTGLEPSRSESFKLTAENTQQQKKKGGCC